MQKGAKDIYPHEFDLDEEVNRLVLEFALNILAEVEESIVEDGEFGSEEPNDGNSSSSEGSSEEA